jgi:hypothetical protein
METDIKKLIDNKKQQDIQKRILELKEESKKIVDQIKLIPNLTVEEARAILTIASSVLESDINETKFI